VYFRDIKEFILNILFLSIFIHTMFLQINKYKLEKKVYFRGNQKQQQSLKIRIYLKTIYGLKK